MSDCCEHCGHSEPSLEEIYDGYWNAVACMVDQGLLPKDFVEKEIKETMRQAEILMKMESGGASGKTIKFAEYSSLPEVR